MRPCAYFLTLDQTCWDTLSPCFMHASHTIAAALASAFLPGPWTAKELNSIASRVLGKRRAWTAPFSERVASFLQRAPRPTAGDLAAFIRHDAGFQKACQKHDLRVLNWLSTPASMRPTAVAAAWQVPPIHNPAELATWLGVRLSELDWFADRRQLGQKQHRARLGHYHYRALSKRSGHIRLIESPKPRLKEIQRRILREILDPIPVHAAAQGFRPGTSICTFAQPHVGRRVVLRLDLRDFFPSVPQAQVRAIFRTCGYPDSVAELLTCLCVNATPHEIWEAHQPAETAEANAARWCYANPHLPQGAPTSPALANLAAYRLDCRLSGLTHAAGGVYSRYADDLAFSGDEGFQQSARRFLTHAGAIVMEEGFHVHFRKTRVMPQAARQQLAGVVVNEKLNVRRPDFDRLKAILTNCVRHGPETQNHAAYADFRRHLEGRVSFFQMVNPQRAERLKEIFDRISW